MLCNTILQFYRTRYFVTNITHFTHILLGPIAEYFCVVQQWDKMRRTETSPSELKQVSWDYMKQVSWDYIKMFIGQYYVCILVFSQCSEYKSLFSALYLTQLNRIFLSFTSRNFSFEIKFSNELTPTSVKSIPEIWNLSQIW